MHVKRVVSLVRMRRGACRLGGRGDAHVKGSARLHHQARGQAPTTATRVDKRRLESWSVV